MCSDFKSNKNQCIYTQAYEIEMENCLRCSYDSILKFQTCDECNQESVPFISDPEFQTINCTTDCDYGQFVYQQECVNCIDNCKICNNKQNCQQCKSEFLKSTEDFQCVKECKNNEYITQGFQFQECTEGTIENCIKYYDFEDQCSKCIDGMVTYQQGLSKNECVSQCPDYFYADKEKGSCQQCYNQLCLQCNDQLGQICTLCQDDSTLDNGQCIKNCQSGEYSFNFTQCKQCSKQCKECKEKDYQCTKCYKNQVFYESLQKCQDGETCIEGFYLKQGNLCDQCNSQCKQCQYISTHCIQCNEEHVLQDSNCQEKCNEGYGLLSQNNVCLQCQDTHCEICYSNYQICQKCESGYVIQQITNNKKCAKCHTSCSTCFGIQNNQCYSCKDEFKYDEVEKTCYLELENSDNTVGYIILFTSIAITLIIIGIGLYCFQKKQKNKYKKKEILLKNDILCELEQQYNFQANQNIVFNQDNINKFNQLHQKHQMTELQFKQQYKRIKNLGQGSFGVVEQFYDKMNKQDVAIKFFKTLKSDEILELGLKEAEQIEQINKLSQFYTIKQFTYFLIECESIQNSIQRYQENDIPKKIKSDSQFNKNMQQNNCSINNNNIQQISKIGSNNKISIQQKNKTNSQTNSTNSIIESNYDSLFGSVQNDSYTLYLNKQNEQQQQSIEISNNIINNDNENQIKFENSVTEKQKDKDKIQKKNQQEEENQQEEQEQETIKELAIVFEIAEYSLADKIGKKRLIDQPFNKQEIIQFLQNMTSVLYDFHEKMHLSHRDIKPQNILYVNNCWKLADFGMSKFLDINQSVTNNYTLTGTLNYQSPEQKNNYVNQLSSTPQLAIPLNPFKCDIFSLGITCYEMATLKKVDNLNQNQHIMFQSLNKFLKPQTELYNNEIIEVIELMLQWEPQKRSSIKIIKEKVDFIVEQNKNEKITNLL